MKTSKITLLLLAATIPTFGQSYFNFDWIKEYKVALGLGFGTVVGILFVKDSYNKTKKIEALAKRLEALEKQPNTLSTITQRVTQCEEDITNARKDVKRVEDMLGIFSTLLYKINKENDNNWNYFSCNTLPALVAYVAPEAKGIWQTAPKECAIEGLASSAYRFSRGGVKGGVYLNPETKKNLDAELELRNKKLTPKLDHLKDFKNTLKRNSSTKLSQ